MEKIKYLRQEQQKNQLETGCIDVLDQLTKAIKMDPFQFTYDIYMHDHSGSTCIGSKSKSKSTLQQLIADRLIRDGYQVRIRYGLMSPYFEFTIPNM